MIVVAVFVVIVLVVALASRHLVNGPVTPPTIMAVAGLVLVWAGEPALDLETSGLRLATEITLSLVLFVDATRIPLRDLGSAAGLPGRLLGIGLPLSIALLTGLSMVVLGVGLGPALLVGAALSATDAALARIVVESPDLPAGLRQTVNVESGLNDGLATPVVTVAIALMIGEMVGAGGVLDALVRPLLSAMAIGLVVGAGAGWLLRRARDRDGVDPVLGQLSIVALVALVVIASIAAGSIMFVAAFLAGSAFRQTFGSAGADIVDFAEDAARLLTLGAFFAFGLTLLPRGLAGIELVDLLIVVVALTLGRMVPVWVSFLGTGVALPTTALIGWFGPRGLATVLFGLLAAEEAEQALPERALAVLSVTVLASLVLHGATAAPLTARYAAWLERQRRDPDKPPVPGIAMTRDTHAEVEVGRTRA